MLIYGVLADLVVFLHACYVGFVVVGYVAIVLGAFLSWRWIRNPYFRAAHLAAIALVAVQSMAGIVCPLTTLENALRERAGAAPYPGSFVGHWLDRLIFYQGPPWLFIFLYVAFAGLAVILFFIVPPCPLRRPSSATLAKRDGP